MKSSFAEHVLPNGLRVICEVMPDVCSAAVAFLVRTGSRHEQPSEHGVSHFLEHMCFKGTRRRTYHDINVRFDELGSIYNAYTSKEHTVYYGWTPREHMDAQIELLADIMRPVLPPDEFEMERKVVLEEIAMSADSFDHNVSDFLHRTCFGEHPLAHEILGEQESIEHLPREAMLDYMARRYGPENICFIATGAIDPQEAMAAAGRYCGHWRRGGDGAVGLTPPGALPAGVHRNVLSRFNQQSIAIAYPSCAPGGPYDESVDVFCSLFGGGNSRCYWNIVQKGVCSEAGAVWLSYLDHGMLVFHVDGEPERCEEMHDAIRREMADVIRAGVSEEEVQRVKNKRRTQLALESEDPHTRLMQLIEDIEVYGGPQTAASRLAAVEAVSRKSIAAYFERYPIAGEGLVLSVGPQEWPA